VSSISLPGVNRQGAKRHKHWRWLIFLGAAIAAVMWRTRTAISTVPERSRETFDGVASSVRRRMVRDDGAAPSQPGSVAMEKRPSSDAPTEPFGLRTADGGRYGVVSADDGIESQSSAAGSIEGDGTAVCPDGFPIKGNTSSHIFHMPGQSSYAKTIPGVCFATEEDARSAGYRARAR
jgi:hypothetical protein